MTVRKFRKRHFMKYNGNYTSGLYSGLFYVYFYVTINILMYLAGILFRNGTFVSIDIGSVTRNGDPKIHSIPV